MCIVVYSSCGGEKGRQNGEEGEMVSGPPGPGGLVLTTQFHLTQTHFAGNSIIISLQDAH